MAGAGTLVLWWSARLPDPVASHWGLARRRWNLFAGSTPRRLARHRNTADCPSWWDREAYLAQDFPVGVIVIVVLLSVLLGALAAAPMPAAPMPATSGLVPADASRTPLLVDERVISTATVRMRGTDEVTAVSIVLVVVAVVLTGQPALLGFLLVPALLIALGRWWVTVDHTGLWARSLLGAPRTGVALGEVVRADVMPLHPLREFGGWGIRSDLQSRYGLVLRAGDAFAVQRAGGGVFVDTVDGADDGVALLNGLADRARAT